MNLILHKICSNPTAKSIESELFKAFCKAGAISEDNSDDPKKVRGFDRYSKFVMA
jgi:hypothetical protein